MRVTIIRDDDAVNIDGERQTVDCSSLPTDFHALQWDGFAGEVEYGAVLCGHCGMRSKKPNMTISDLAPYQKFLDGWHAARQKAI